MKIGARPFRDSTPLNELDPQLLCRLDAFDLNGKDLYQQGINENSEKVYGFLKEISISKLEKLNSLRSKYKDLLPR